MDRRDFVKIAAAGAVISAVSPAGLLSAKEGSHEENPSWIPKADPSLSWGEGIRIRFMGTGAADWNGRDGRGEYRRNTSILIDTKVLIDLTGTSLDMIPEGAKTEVIFYTHSHADHYNPEAALSAGIKRIYLGETWIEKARKEFQKACAKTGLDMPEIIPLSVGQKIQECGIVLTALPANHATSDLGEQTLMYLLEKDSARVLYATDTGGIPAIAARLAEIDAHKKGRHISGLIMEATMGLGHDSDYRIFTHSSVATVLQTVKILSQTERYIPHVEGQKVYLTHMARTLHGTQAELDRDLPAPLKAAYDSLEVEFR